MEDMKKRLENLKETLTKAYVLTGGIPVKGESLDAMAMARQSIREAFHLAKSWLAELDEQAEGSDHG